MKIFLSYTQFPELSRYSSQQKKVIWLNLSQWTGGSERTSWSGFIPAIIIASFLLGMIVGAFVASDPDRGCFWGGMIGIMTPAPFIYLVGINSRRKVLQQYLQSEEFSLVPVNEKVRTLLGPCWDYDCEFPPSSVRPLEGPDPHVPELAGLNTFGAPELTPIPRFVEIVLQMAIHDQADQLEFLLVDAESESGFRISYTAKGTQHQMHPAPGHLFGPVVVVLCNCADCAYYAKGPVKGKFYLKEPDSCWILESDDLKKHVLLSKA